MARAGTPAGAIWYRKPVESQSVVVQNDLEQDGF